MIQTKIKARANNRPYHLIEKGIKRIISGLKIDPTKSNGSIPASVLILISSKNPDMYEKANHNLSEARMLPLLFGSSILKESWLVGKSNSQPIRSKDASATIWFKYP